MIVAVNLIGGKSEVNDISGDNAAIPASPCTIEKPDIFYIVFDEYPSSKSLQEDLGFNNEVIDSLLKASGFFCGALLSE